VRRGTKVHLPIHPANTTQSEHQNSILPYNSKTIIQERL
jgi:hypothetical protein